MKNKDLVEITKRESVKLLKKIPDVARATGDVAYSFAFPFAFMNTLAYAVPSTSKFKEGQLHPNHMWDEFDKRTNDVLRTDYHNLSYDATTTIEMMKAAAQIGGMLGGIVSFIPQGIVYVLSAVSPDMPPYYLIPIATNLASLAVERARTPTRASLETRTV